MKCPDCEKNIEIKDWMDDEPFECPDCGITLQRLTGEGGYCGANEKRLVLCE
jgi:predicted nucleic acid-binding Zn ribbon protein